MVSDAGVEDEVEVDTTEVVAEVVEAVTVTADKETGNAQTATMRTSHGGTNATDARHQSLMTAVEVAAAVALVAAEACEVAQACVGDQGDLDVVAHAGVAVQVTEVASDVDEEASTEEGVVDQ